MNNPTRVIKDKTYPDMYRLQWPDKVLSEDMYNLTRANDILKNYKLYQVKYKYVDIDNKRTRVASDYKAHLHAAA